VLSLEFIIYATFLFKNGGKIKQVLSYRRETELQDGPVLAKSGRWRSADI